MSSKVTVKNVNIGIDEGSRAKIAEGLSKHRNTPRQNLEMKLPPKITIADHFKDLEDIIYFLQIL